MGPVPINVQGTLQLCLIETYKLSSVVPDKVVDYPLLHLTVQPSHIEGDHVEL